MAFFFSYSDVKKDFIETNEQRNKLQKRGVAGSLPDSIRKTKEGGGGGGWVRASTVLIQKSPQIYFGV